METDIIKISDDENEPMEVMDDSDESDDSSASDNAEEEQNRRAEELEQQISANKYLYDAHIELVDIYRNLGDLKSMRAAYQRFHEIFPLTSKLWLSWIKDEIKVASTENDKKNIFSLFEKAVEDYLSIELWVEYAQYSIGASDLQTTREILEKGLRAGGLHVSQGSLLWDTLRELELAHFSMSPPESDQWKEQLKRVVDVFKRQLSVPLLDMENTYHEWEEFIKSLPDNHGVDTKPIEWGYNNALKILETYKPFEQRLLATDDENECYEIYKEYAQIVTDPSAKLCLYERAAAALCLNPALWYDYCVYALSLGKTAVSVSKRALRNIPWSEELWAIRLRILENQNEAEDSLRECFEQGIASVSPPALKLWLTYIEYVIRNSDSKEKLDKLCSQAAKQVGQEGDPTAKISRLHARILAKNGNMAGAKKIWNTLVHWPQNKGVASVWLEYANLERQYGEPHQLRNIYQRALSACKQWPQYIADEWLLYERENGKLSDVLKCIEKCSSVLKLQQTVQENVENSDIKPEELPKGKKRKQEKHENHDSNAKRTKNEEDNKPSVTTRKPRKPVDRDPKTTVFVSNLHPKVTEDKLQEFFPSAENVELVYDRKGLSRCYGYVQFKMEEEVMHALARDREPLDGRPIFISVCKPDRNERKSNFKYSDDQEPNKLFIRGLPITKTKADIEELYKPYGAVEVRLVTHKSGQSKGLAYVQFPDDKKASEALKATDQMDIDGHVITVAISAPPKKVTGPPIKEPVRHARSKLSVPLIPRQLQVKNSQKSDSGSSNENNQSANNPPKTNEDFRKMLLKN